MRFGMRYPLVDRTEYDDEHGTGFDHAEPARPCSNTDWRVDCWIVDRDGNRHPAIDASPVPVRNEGIDLTAGFPVLFDVVEVNMDTFRVAVLDRQKSEMNAVAIVAMAVARRGVEDRFFATCPTGLYNDGDRYAADE